ncbi:hypothetical protein Cgig2_000942 [Carnegiea gigantea]|uniref:Endonuclease/exonuclease/phosphatase domain-containing protein n=1 Tax=Carnegiea gigantea TaxID=171969 RepID=A0A9Q1JFG9_9CARY|nr:hypothetical protein Cgig2_000942 [Carnegiea gigantea]
MHKSFIAKTKETKMATINMLSMMTTGINVDPLTTSRSSTKPRDSQLYASLVNLDKASIINGVKCAKITTEDVTPEIKCRQSAILCSVLRANPPLEVMKAYLRRHCRMYGYKEEECKKKTIIRKEWRKVPMQTKQERKIAESNNNIQSQEAVAVSTSLTQRMDAKGFTLVMRPSTRRHHSPRNITGEMRDQNPFASFHELQGGLDFELQKEGWNIRGLNWPNKQEDVKIFLHEKQIGLVGLLKTKVKEKNVEKVANKIFQVEYQRKNLGCLEAIPFYLTFIYGANQEGQRRLLWEALTATATDMEEAWCILGDFNSVLHPGDRLGGTDIQDVEIKPFEECINTCEIQQMRSIGRCFTWTNKTIWTRIDRAFTRDYGYLPLVASQLTASSHQRPCQRLKMFLWNTKKAQQQLHKSHYADLKTQ